MERIRVEIEWDAPDGAFDDLTNEGDGEGDLVDAAREAMAVAGANATVNAYRGEI